jgi:Cytosine deaminase and related metal-dependent hydrolases
MTAYEAIEPLLPERPPFAIRARLLTPLTDGGTRFERDATLRVDGRGRISNVGTDTADAVDLRPMLLLPGMVDLHAHLPQLPNAGLGAGLDLLTWLERYIFPLERNFDADTARHLAPLAFRAFAAAGTTTVVLYGAVYQPSTDAAFEAAEAHGIRTVIGKVMMDRLRYDSVLPDAEVLETSLLQSADLIDRWHGCDDGRLRYAVTPRFAVSCSADILRESAALAQATGTYWQTHLAEDHREIAEVGRLFPEALDYTDVYDRAGGLGASAILAHAIHLSDREVARLADTGSNVAHCPASNLFLASGAMPLSRYLAAGVSVGLGSDVAGGPDLSIFGAMRAGAYTQNGRRAMLGDPQPSLGPLDWLRMGTLDGARALGQQNEIGSLETGKEADFILVDPDRTAPLPEAGVDEADELMSRLIFRSHPDMLRGAWVRGRRLAAQ